MASDNLRNVAVIAHVDHGKTTLVDGLLKQAHTFRDNEAAMSQELIMDSNDQERERGITILAKNTAVVYQGVKINIIDTPGHADFGGEVERTLNMADGALLIVDAQEGPMPGTKFVLKKALELGLKIIVVINKIDKSASQPAEVEDKVADLFLELATHEDHLDFPVIYAISREGKAWATLPAAPAAPADLTPLFDAILEYIPAPKTESGPLQMLATTLAADKYQGKTVIGRVRRGAVKPGMAVLLIHNNQTKAARADKVYVSLGLKRLEVPEAEAGEIVAITGLGEANIGDTIPDPAAPEALPTISIEAPTLKMAVGPNTSPFAGREGQFVTGRHLLERIKREVETNVALKWEMGEDNSYVLSGRGELHLSVFIETLRREGFELEVGKAHVITKEIDSVVCEPLEELTVDIAADAAGVAIAAVGQRRGMLLEQSDNSDGSIRLRFEITTRAMLGLRNQLLTLSKGTAVLNSLFLRYTPLTGTLPKIRNGVLITSENGRAMTYGLNNAQGRGITFIPPGTEVYRGMIIGLNSREEDIDMNVTKEKQLTNIRAASGDMATILTPPTLMSLEECLDFLEDDELLEVTPKSLRLRKKILDPQLRNKDRKGTRKGTQHF